MLPSTRVDVLDYTSHALPVGATHSVGGLKREDRNLKSFDTSYRISAE